MKAVSFLLLPLYFFVNCDENRRWKKKNPTWGEKTSCWVLYYSELKCRQLEVIVFPMPLFSGFKVSVLCFDIAVTIQDILLCRNVFAPCFCKSEFAPLVHYPQKISSGASYCNRSLTEQKGRRRSADLCDGKDLKNSGQNLSKLLCDLISYSCAFKTLHSQAPNSFFILPPPSPFTLARLLSKTSLTYSTRLGVLVVFSKVTNSLGRDLIFIFF